VIKGVLFDVGDTLVVEEAILSGRPETTPHAKEVLEVLRPSFKLAVICDTAASTEEVEEIMKNLGIRRYFDDVVVSSEVGASKPDERIFRVALERIGLKPEEVVMVGNRISKDILGGNRLGMKTVLYKWNNRYSEKIASEFEKPTFTIKSLSELLPILARMK